MRTFWNFSGRPFGYSALKWFPQIPVSLIDCHFSRCCGFYNIDLRKSIFLSYRSRRNCFSVLRPLKLHIIARRTGIFNDLFRFFHVMPETFKLADPLPDAGTTGTAWRRDARHWQPLGSLGSSLHSVRNCAYSPQAYPFAGPPISKMEKVSPEYQHVSVYFTIAQFQSRHIELFLATR